MMKRLCKPLVLLAVLLLAPHLKAQQTLINTPHQELRLTVGALLSVDGLFGYDGCGGYYMYCPNGLHPEFYNGNLYGTPVLSLSYHYQVKRWFSLGVAASFHTEYQRTYKFVDDSPTWKERSTFFAITPIARFDWFRWDFIKLYSSIGMGFGVNIDRDKNLTSDASYKRRELGISFDIVPFAITMGRKVYGFAELGAGSMGFLRAGVGYRFPDKKSKINAYEK